MRSYIFVSFKLGSNATAIHGNLVKAFGSDACSYDTVVKWINRFKDGKMNISDSFRSGRPITETTPQNIALVDGLIKEDPHITYDQIEELTNLNHWVINKIIHEHLNLKKISSRWVPHFLTEAQKAKRLEYSKFNLAKFEENKWRLCDIITGDESWIYYRKIEKRQSSATWVEQGQKPQVIAKRSQYEPKSMISVFFKTTGPVLVDCLDKGQTIDHIYYIENCLKSVVKQIFKERPKSGTNSIKLLHDNARPHTHSCVKEYLESVGIKIIPHPPYSPDLAPCDYWLFEKIKSSLTTVTDAKSLHRQITEILKNIPKEEYLKTFQKYLERLKHCINNNGDYFEHLIK